MNRLWLFCCVLSLIYPLTYIGQDKAKGCTIGVVSGKATADGRPLLWRNRDGWGRDYELAYFKNGRFKHLSTAYPGYSQAIIGAAVNEFGFCIVEAAAFDLEDKSGRIPGIKNILSLALRQCVTVDDFESLLKQTNISGRTTQGNIGIIDAFGGAAIFEIGSSFYTRFDATNPQVAPQGYVIRTNFAITGGGDIGRARYDRANQLWKQAVEKDQLDYRYVLRKVCRDLSDSEEISYTQPEMEITEDNALKVLNNQNSISRPGTTNVALFHGVKPDENPSLTTFWVILGGPIFSVAVPSWVIAESTAPELDGQEFSPICLTANDLYLANYVTNNKRKLLLNPEMLPDIWALTYPAEDRIFDQTESIMAQWRQDYPTAQEVASFHRSMASEAMGALEEVTGMLMRKGGPTANLRIALHMRSVEKAKAFIEGCANINVSDGHGYTPLHYAVQNNLKEIVQLLISKNADVNAKNRSGQTPLDVAIQQNHKNIMELLTANGAKSSSIFTAAAIGDPFRVKAFLAEGVNINAKGPRGRTALHIAASEGHKEVVELLLENGTKVNAGDNMNRTAAELAMNRGHTEIAELLIFKGADVSPLHFALYMKDEAKAKSLIEAGADVNKRTPYGTTPIHRAVSAKGADVTARDGDSRTPLWYAQDEGHTEIVELLRKHEAEE